MGIFVDTHRAIHGDYEIEVALSSGEIEDVLHRCIISGDMGGLKAKPPTQSQ